MPARAERTDATQRRETAAPSFQRRRDVQLSVGEIHRLIAEARRLRSEYVHTSIRQLLSRVTRRDPETDRVTLERKTMIGILSQWKPALTIMALLSSAVIAGAQETTNTEGTRPAQGTSMECADRHVQLLTLIEYLGEAPDFAGDKLFKTLVASMRARDVCAEGQETKALSLYDRAVLDLVFPVGSLR
jgi:hypothetical protein